MLSDQPTNRRQEIVIALYVIPRLDTLAGGNQIILESLHTKCANHTQGSNYVPDHTTLITGTMQALSTRQTMRALLTKRTTQATMTTQATFRKWARGTPAMGTTWALRTMLNPCLPCYLTDFKACIHFRTHTL